MFNPLFFENVQVDFANNEIRLDLKKYIFKKYPISDMMRKNIEVKFPHCLKYETNIINHPLWKNIDGDKLVLKMNKKERDDFIFDKIDFDKNTFLKNMHMKEKDFENLKFMWLCVKEKNKLHISNFIKNECEGGKLRYYNEIIKPYPECINPIETIYKNTYGYTLRALISLMISMLIIDEMDYMKFIDYCLYIQHIEDYKERYEHLEEEYESSVILSYNSDKYPDEYDFSDFILKKMNEVGMFERMHKIIKDNNLEDDFRNETFIDEDNCIITDHRIVWIFRDDEVLTENGCNEGWPLCMLLRNFIYLHKNGWKSFVDMYLKSIQKSHDLAVRSLNSCL